MRYLLIIQARLFSTRFPGKVMQLVNGKPMVKRVWDAAYKSFADKVIVLWPERNPDVSESDLYTPFCRLIKEFEPEFVIRLTADCPLITTTDINEAIRLFELGRRKLPIMHYYNNGRDGYDVQIFTPEFMYSHPNKAHVLDVEYNYNGLSVNTPEDLTRVRTYAR